MATHTTGPTGWALMGPDGAFAVLTDGRVSGWAWEPEAATLVGGRANARRLAKGLGLRVVQLVA